MFPPGKWGRGISRESWGFKFTVSREIYVGIPVNFSYISKDFRGTDIPHSDIKNALLQILNLFSRTKNYFSKAAKFFKTKCLRDQNFFLSLSKKLKNSN